MAQCAEGMLTLTNFCEFCCAYQVSIVELNPLNRIKWIDWKGLEITMSSRHIKLKAPVEIDKNCASTDVRNKLCPKFRGNACIGKNPMTSTNIKQPPSGSWTLPCLLMRLIRNWLNFLLWNLRLLLAQEGRSVCQNQMWLESRMKMDEAGNPFWMAHWNSKLLRCRKPE